MTFNDKADGGTYEYVYFDYNFATSEAKASGTYSDRSYYQVDGKKGTFVYNIETNRYTMTVTHEYRIPDTATTHYASDYKWLTMNEIAKLDHAAESMTQTLSGEFLLTGDRALINSLDNQKIMIRALKTPEGPMFYLVSETANRSSMSKSTVFYYSNGSTKTYEKSVDYELVIEGTTITATTTTTEKDFTASEPVTEKEINEYEINSFFVHGEETANQKLVDVWKKGNTVTFNTSRFRQKFQVYSESNPLGPAPDVDSVTGIGDNPFYWIDQTLKIRQFNLVHLGEYVSTTDSLKNASRQLK